MHTMYIVALLLHCAIVVTCGIERGRSVLDKLSILEEDIVSMNNKMIRMERNRKTDLRIFEHDINLQIKEMVSEVLSDVILDKVRSGEVSGVVDDGVNAIIKRQQQQLHQLKTLVTGVVRRKLPVVNVPRKVDSSQEKIKRLARRLSKFQKQLKELNDEVLHVNLKVIDVKNLLRESEKERGKGREGEKERDKRAKETSITQRPSTDRPMDPLKQRHLVSGVTPKPSTEKAIKEIEVCVGRTIDLTCTSTGSDEASWYKEDARITYGLRSLHSSSRFSLLHGYSHEWHLRIVSLSYSDSGLYRCQAGPKTMEELVLIVKPCYN